MTNSGPTPTGTFDQLVRFNSSQYRALVNSNWTNGQAFYLQNGTPVNLWIESNASNASAQTDLWLRLYSIPAGGVAYLVLQFGPKTGFVLSSSGFTGENPLLSSPYGEFDNGRRVFNFYDNFARTSLGNGWTVSGTWGYSVNNGVSLTSIAGNGGYISTNASFAFPEAVDFHGDLFEYLNATAFEVEGIGTSGCAGCGTAASVGYDAGGGNSFQGPAPFVGLGSNILVGTPYFSSQQYATFTTIAWNTSSASFLVNYTSPQTLLMSLPSSPQPVGLAMSGHPSGSADHTEKTYWIRERTVADAAVTSIQQVTNGSVALVAYPGTLLVNQSLTLVASVENFPFPSYAYSGLPTGCSSVNRATLSCVVRQTGQFSPRVTVSNPVGDAISASTNLTVELANISGGTAPLVAGLVAVPQAPVVNSTLTLITSFHGGVGPFHFAYASLPAGCASADQFYVSCTPQSPGALNVVVTVTDSVAESSTASVAVDVVAGPPAGSILPLRVSLTAFSGALQTGSPLEFVAAVSGGLPPYSYSYSGLPAGCTSSDSGSLVCVPTTSGQFSVVVTVTDALQHTASGSSVLTLTAANPSPSSTGSGVSPTLLDGVLGIAVAALVVAAVSVLLALRGRAPAQSRPP